MTPSKLRQLADDTDQRALSLAAAGDVRGAAALSALAEAYRAVASEQEGLAPRPNTAHDVGTMESVDTRGLKIAKTKTGGRRRHRAVQALYDAGLTPATAAAICGTSRDVLKQAWAKDPQFREIRPEWEAKLEKAGVPRSVWPRKG